MLNKIAKKIAVATNVVIFLQLAFFGLNANAGVALAKENSGSETIRISSDITAQNFVAGQDGNFNIKVDNTNGLDYSDVWALVKMDNAQKSDILTLNYMNGETPVDVTTSLEEEGSDLYALQDLGSMINGFSRVYNFSLKFKTPKTYGLEIELYENREEEGNILASLLLNEDHGSGFVVAPAATSLTTTLGDADHAVVKNQTPLTFDVTLDNTYGANFSHVLGNFVIKNTTVSEIQKLEYFDEKTENWQGMTAVLTADKNGTDVDGFFGPTEGFPVDGSYKATTQFRVTFNATEKTDKKYEVTFSATDLDSAKVLAAAETSVTVDGTAPVVTVTTLPTAVNDASKYQKVTLTANEAMKLVPSLVDAGVVLTQGDNPAAVVTVEEQTDPKVIVVDIAAGSFSGTDPIHLVANVQDLMGNVGKVEQDLTVDATAPLAVTNFTVTLNSDNQPVLTWANPNVAADVAGINILRNGAPYAFLAAGNTTFTDTAAEKGQTYKYEVRLYDVAGNEVGTTPVSITVPAPAQVAAVTTDTVAPAPAAQKDDKSVKSESTENKPENKKNSFPTWSILVLIVLVILGLYLYFTGEPESKPVAQTVRITEKKTTKKKTSKKK